MLELRKRADKSGKPERMITEEVRVPGTDKTVEVERPQWPLLHVELVGDAPAKHNFSDDFVARSSEEGWLELEGAQLRSIRGYSRNPVLAADVIVLKLETGTLRYEVVQSPGKFKGEEIHEYRCKLEKG